MPAGANSPRRVGRSRTIVANPGVSVTDWPVIGSARGDHTLAQIHIEAQSPLGLWLRCAKPPCQNPSAYSAFTPNLRDRATAALFSKTASIGLRVRRQLGRGREFDNLRQYMPGDSFEDIHWKATARRGFPTVKLYQVEHAQEVYAIVDSSRLSLREGVPGSPILESYVEAALHLVSGRRDAPAIASAW